MVDTGKLYLEARIFSIEDALRLIETYDIETVTDSMKRELKMLKAELKEQTNGRG